MKTITLVGGRKTLVDDEDYERLSQFRWYYCSSNGYAWTPINRKTVLLHHLVLPHEEGKVNDHINRVKLDNRRCNLRRVTQSENVLNAPLNKRNNSGVRGLRFTEDKTWAAHVQRNGVSHTLGCYKTKTEARAVLSAFLEQGVKPPAVRPTTRNKAGVRGVLFDTVRQRWAVYVKGANGSRNLGRFDSKEEAVARATRYYEHERG